MALGRNQPNGRDSAIVGVLLIPSASPQQPALRCWTFGVRADALRQLDVPNRPGLTYRKRQARSGAVMVVVYRDTTGSVDTGFNEVSGPGFLCYRPVSTILAPNRA